MRDITDIVSDNTFEYDFCANRGLCDFDSGTCLCFDEYAGANCANPTYESSIDSSTNALPGLSMTATGLDYTGNIVELLTQKAAASALSHGGILLRTPPYTATCNLVGNRFQHALRNLS